MKTIVIAVGSSQLGGAEKQSLLLAKALSSKYQVEMIFLGPRGPFLDKVKESGIIFHLSKGSVFSDFIILLNVLRQSRPHTLINFLYRADLLGGLVGKFLRIRNIINSARNTTWPNETRLKRYKLKFAAKVLPNYVVANSLPAAKWHAAIGYPEGKLRVIRNFLDIELISESLSPSRPFHNPLRLGIASRAVMGKGHETLLKAATLLNEKGLKCEIWFKGPDISIWKDLQTWISIQPVEVNLQDIDTDMASWLTSIDIYCGISESWESDSNSINEAALCKKPLIITNIIDAVDYVPVPEVVKPDDASEVANSINRILKTSKSILESDLEERRTNLIHARNTKGIMESWESLLN